MAVEVFMPKMSDHMENGEIAEWLANEGDRVEVGQIVVEVVTDKTTAEIEAPASGIIRGIRKGAEKGAVVPVGEVMAFITEEGEEAPVLPPLGEREGKRKEADVKKGKENRTAAHDRSPAAVRSAVNEGSSSGVKAAPAARRRARELQIDLRNIKGTGPGGMITENDVDTCAQSPSKE